MEHVKSFSSDEDPQPEAGTTKVRTSGSENGTKRFVDFVSHIMDGEFAEHLPEYNFPKSSKEIPSKTRPSVPPKRKGSYSVSKEVLQEMWDLRQLVDSELKELEAKFRATKRTLLDAIDVKNTIFANSYGIDINSYVDAFSSSLWSPPPFNPSNSSHPQDRTLDWTDSPSSLTHIMNHLTPSHDNPSIDPTPSYDESPIAVSQSRPPRHQALDLDVSNGAFHANNPLLQTPSSASSDHFKGYYYAQHSATSLHSTPSTLPSRTQAVMRSASLDPNLQAPKILHPVDDTGDGELDLAAEEKFSSRLELAVQPGTRHMLPGTITQAQEPAEAKIETENGPSIAGANIHIQDEITSSPLTESRPRQSNDTSVSTSSSSSSYFILSSSLSSSQNAPTISSEDQHASAAGRVGSEQGGNQKGSEVCEAGLLDSIQEEEEGEGNVEMEEKAGGMTKLESLDGADGRGDHGTRETSESRDHVERDSRYSTSSSQGAGKSEAWDSRHFPSKSSLRGGYQSSLQSHQFQSEYNPAELFGGARLDKYPSDRDSIVGEGGDGKLTRLWARAARFLGAESKRSVFLEMDRMIQKKKSKVNKKRGDARLSFFRGSFTFGKPQARTHTVRAFKNDSSVGRTKENIHFHELLLETRLLAKDSIILPGQQFSRYWTLLLALVFIYIILAVPFLIAFYYIDQAPKEFALVETVVSVILLADVVVLLNTGLYTEVGVLTCERREILRQYLKSWLIPDILAAIPWSILQGELIASLNPLAHHNSLKILLLLRVPKLLHLNRLFDDYASYTKRSVEKMRIYKVILAIVIVCHYNACFWYLIGSSASAAKVTWMTEADALANARGDPITTVLEKYLLSFYASVVSLTTVGYGDVVPTNNLERIYAAVMLLVGSTIFSFLVASTSNYVSQTDALEHNKQTQLRMIKSLIDHHSLEDDLRNRILMFSQYQLERDISGDQNVLLRQLPAPLRREVMMKIHGDLMLKSKAFEGCEVSVIQRLAVEVEAVCFLPNQAITQAGDMAEQMVIVNKGFVEEFTQLGQDFLELCASIGLLTHKDAIFQEPAQTVSILSYGHMWGEAGLLREAEILSRRSVTFVEAAEISLKSIEHVCSSFPAMSKELQQRAARRHAKHRVLTRKLTHLSQDQDGDAQFARDFIRARTKISNLMLLVQRAYESKTFTEDEVRNFLTVQKRKKGKKSDGLKMVQDFFNQVKRLSSLDKKN